MPELAHPEFRWIDTAVGGASRRNHLHDVTRWRLRRGVPDCFRTWARYPDEMRQHCARRRDAAHPRGSVAGYTGQLFADDLPQDVDRADLGEALEATRVILHRLEVRHDLPLSAPRVYFSGSKGFHVMLPTALFQPTPGPALHRVFAAMAGMLLEEIPFDWGVYDSTRLWRCPNTVNSRSGLYKVPLSAAEVLHLDISQIEDLARAPRRGLPAHQGRRQTLASPWGPSHPQPALPTSLPFPLESLLPHSSRPEALAGRHPASGSHRRLMKLTSMDDHPSSARQKCNAPGAHCGTAGT